MYNNTEKFFNISTSEKVQEIKLALKKGTKPLDEVPVLMWQTVRSLPVALKHPYLKGNTHGNSR